MKNYYVTNAQILPEIKKFRETGVASEKLGHYMLLIATNLARKGNFQSYTWKEDMIGEAVLTCIKYAKSFDPQKSDNPYSYITSICKNAFKSYLKKQKKHSEIKDLCYNAKEMIDYGEVVVDYSRFKT